MNCLYDIVLSFQVITNLVKMLKSRDTRRNFCPPNHWLSEQEDIKADKVSGKSLIVFIKDGFSAFVFLGRVSLFKLFKSSLKF